MQQVEPCTASTMLQPRTLEDTCAVSTYQQLLHLLTTMSPVLQVASFERNPLTGLPNYRQKVLQLLPNLENLDGQVQR